MAQARNRAFAGALIPLLTFATCALLCPACSVTVGQQNPHPNVALSPQERGLHLALGSDVQEHLSAGQGHVEIERWHETLIAGFQNAFGGSDGAPAKGEDDLVLTLDQTRVELGRFDLSSARIQYKATLTKGDVVVQRFAGVAMKKGVVNYPQGAAALGYEVSADIAGAVEDMYEQIAKELSEGAAAPAAGEPPRCVPGRSVACVGRQGCQGFQLCASDGTFGACSCGS